MKEQNRLLRDIELSDFDTECGEVMPQVQRPKESELWKHQQRLEK